MRAKSRAQARLLTPRRSAVFLNLLARGRSRPYIFKGSQIQVVLGHRCILSPFISCRYVCTELKARRHNGCIYRIFMVAMDFGCLYLFMVRMLFRTVIVKYIDPNLTSNYLLRNANRGLSQKFLWWRNGKINRVGSFLWHTH